MPYIRLNQDGSREYLEERPNYFFDGGIPVTDEWLINNENVYPVVEQDISEETDVVDTVDKDIDDWTVEATQVVRNVWVVKDQEPDYDIFYQSLQLKDEEDWITETDYIYRTFDIITQSVDEVKLELKESLKELRQRIEMGGYKFYYDSTSQAEYHRIESDMDSQSQISSYYGIVETFETINWKSYDSFILLTSDEMANLHINLRNFVKGCFDNELRISILIDDAIDYDALKTIYSEQFDEGWSNEESIYLEGE